MNKNKSKKVGKVEHKRMLQDLILVKSVEVDNLKADIDALRQKIETRFLRIVNRAGPL